MFASVSTDRPYFQVANRPRDRWSTTSCHFTSGTPTYTMISRSFPRFTPPESLPLHRWHNEQAKSGRNRCRPEASSHQGLPRLVSRIPLPSTKRFLHSGRNTSRRRSGCGASCWGCTFFGDRSRAETLLIHRPCRGVDTCAAHDARRTKHCAAFPISAGNTFQCGLHTGTISISIAKMDPVPPSGLIMRPSNSMEFRWKPAAMHFTILRSLFADVDSSSRAESPTSWIYFPLGTRLQTDLRLANGKIEREPLHLWRLSQR